MIVEDSGHTGSGAFRDEILKALDGFADQPGTNRTNGMRLPTSR